MLKLVITGNPGVGKHSVGGLVAAALAADIADLNKLALQVPSTNTDKGLEVDIRRLSSLVSKQLRGKNSVVVIGHLAPYVVDPELVKIVAVLRKSPYELVNALQERGYTLEKTRENVASEILGVTMTDCVNRFGRRKIAEFDVTGKTSDQTAKEILSVIERKAKRQLGSTDWLKSVSERGDMKKFFDY